MSKIPQRWLDYTPIGKPIAGTRFIAFKVPLRPAICANISDVSRRWDVQEVLKTIPNLGLVIDLTNSEKYYPPQDFLGKGVNHVKIMVPGRQVPTSDLRRKFQLIVQDFLKSNVDNDKLIGVHCTHGVNRTGFFICDYMVSDLCMEPQDAIERFQNARGHEIERINYVETLKRTASADTKSKRHREEYYGRCTSSDNSDTRSAVQYNSRRSPQRYFKRRSPSPISNWRDRPASSSRPPPGISNWQNRSLISNRPTYPCYERYSQYDIEIKKKRPVQPTELHSSHNPFKSEPLWKTDRDSISKRSGRSTRDSRDETYNTSI